MRTVSPSASRNLVSRKAIAVAAASTVVEWYDFTLYIYFATVISRTFFGSSASALLTTLGVFGVSYLMRPLGAAFFGHIGDRVGRKPVLLASMALMSAAMAATALLPTYAQIGVPAGIALTVLRFVMAFSVGGEYNAVVTYLVEGAHPSRRGGITALAAAASEVGALLSVGVSALTVTLTSPTQLATWGWRIPFAVGAVLALMTLLARGTLQETPEFLAGAETGAATEAEAPDRASAQQAPPHPLRHPLWEMIRTQPRSIVRTFAISALASVTYYVAVTYVPTYLVSLGAMPERDALWVSTGAAAVLILITPLVGMLSDRVGRKPVLVASAVAAAVLPVLLFWAMGRGVAWIALGVGVLALVAGCYNAVSSTSTAEQFPTIGRLSGLALGVTVATALFGGLTPLLSETLTAATGLAIMPGVVVAVVAMGVLPVLWRLPETAPRKTQNSAAESP